MAVVRKAKRGKDGKLASKALAKQTREMLARVRSADYIEADMIAKSIIEFGKTGKF